MKKRDLIGMYIEILITKPVFKVSSFVTKYDALGTETLRGW